MDTGHSYGYVLIAALAAFIVTVGVGCGSDSNGGTSSSKAEEPLPKLGAARIVGGDPRGRPGGATVDVPVSYAPKPDADRHHRVDRVEASVVARDKGGQTHEFEAEPDSETARLNPQTLEPHTVHAQLPLAPGDAQAVRQVIASGGSVMVKDRATVR